MHAPVRNTEVSPSTAITNPYVGLRPYSREQREIFFGRGRDAELLINKIFSSPLTILYAPSGVGKTSLLRTLVMPDLADAHTHDACVFYHDSYAEAEPEQAIYAAMERAIGGDASLSDGSPLSIARVKSSAAAGRSDDGSHPRSVRRVPAASCTAARPAPS